MVAALAARKGYKEACNTVIPVILLPRSVARHHLEPVLAALRGGRRRLYFTVSSREVAPCGNVVA